jgi:hypothetical protein
MGAIVVAINAVLRFITGAKVLSFSFFTWISSNFITFFFAFQFITWIASGIFTLMLGFYGTEIISSILDVTGVQTYVSSLLSNVFDFGNSIDVSGNAFGTTLDDALLYFHFYDFFNLLISLWFGIFALKINIAVFRATRFNSSKQGILGSMSGYKN